MRVKPNAAHSFDLAPHQRYALVAHAPRGAHAHAKRARSSRRIKAAERRKGRRRRALLDDDRLAASIELQHPGPLARGRPESITVSSPRRDGSEVAVESAAAVPGDDERCAAIVHYPRRKLAEVPVRASTASFAVSRRIGESVVNEKQGAGLLQTACGAGPRLRLQFAIALSPARRSSQSSAAPWWAISRRSVADGPGRQ